MWSRFHSKQIENGLLNKFFDLNSKKGKTMCTWKNQPKEISIELKTFQSFFWLVTKFVITYALDDIIFIPRVFFLWVKELFLLRGMVKVTKKK